MTSMFHDTGRLRPIVTSGLLIWGIIYCSQALAQDKRTEYFPKVTLQTQDGKSVRFYEDLVRDKIVIINFFYSECESPVCNQGTRNLVQVQKALGDRLGREVFLYSITLKPEHDTPEVLKIYAERHGAKNGWTFLTGKLEEINALRSKLGLSNPDPELRRKLGLTKQAASNDPNQESHAGMIAIGYDALNKWTKTSIMSRPDQILQIIERMKPPVRR